MGVIVLSVGIDRFRADSLIFDRHPNTLIVRRSDAASGFGAKASAIEGDRLDDQI